MKIIQLSEAVQPFGRIKTRKKIATKISFLKALQIFFIYEDGMLSIRV